MVTDHKWLHDTPEDAVAQTLKAGSSLMYLANNTVLIVIDIV